MVANFLQNPGIDDPDLIDLTLSADGAALDVGSETWRRMGDRVNVVVLGQDAKRKHRRLDLER